MKLAAQRSRFSADPAGVSASPRRIRIGLTLGDPNGIGPETALIAAHALRMGAIPDADLVLIGSLFSLSEQAKALGWICPPPIPSLSPTSGGAFPGVRTWDPTPRRTPSWQPGRMDAEAARAACDWIDAAVTACRSGSLDAMVTGPISKEGFQAAGIPFAGHTELLADRTGSPRVAMMLTGGPLRVLLATRHLPLRAVPDAITPDLVEQTIAFAAQALDWLGISGGRIGVCGLNPHAGDGGAIGREEQATILPVIEAAKRRGFPVDGPIAGDAIFHQAAAGKFAIVVAMYHDQGLAPLKLVGFRDGVNLTLGLPIVRTSPAHGTAFDLAGRGRASADSLLAAIRMAVRLAWRPSPWRTP